MKKSEITSFRKCYLSEINVYTWGNHSFKVIILCRGSEVGINFIYCKYNKEDHDTKE